jgi:hypothetical protein
MWSIIRIYLFIHIYFFTRHKLFLILLCLNASLLDSKNSHLVSLVYAFLPFNVINKHLLLITIWKIQ